MSCIPDSATREASLFLYETVETVSATVLIALFEIILSSKRVQDIALDLVINKFRFIRRTHHSTNAKGIRARGLLKRLRACAETGRATPQFYV
jgi:hypothetical protein